MIPSEPVEDVGAGARQFPAHLPAASAKAAHVASTTGGATTVTEDWDGRRGGEHLAVHLKYTKAAANRGIGAAVFYNPANPDQYVVSHTDGSTDITAMPPPIRPTGYRTSTSPPRAATCRAAGGRPAALLGFAAGL